MVGINIHGIYEINDLNRDYGGFMKESNKGFSLVELIIVIAIMAILIALLAPQYIRYVEKSKVATDDELLQNINHVITIAVTDENIRNKPMDGLPECLLENINSAGLYDDFETQIKVDLSVDDLSTLKGRLQSANYKGKDIYVEIKDNQNVIISVH